MDGVFDDSPWLPFIRVMDVADGFLYKITYLGASLGLMCVYLCFMGRCLDLILIVCFIGFNHRLFVSSLARQLWHMLCPAALPCAIGIGAACLMLSVLNRKAEEWTGPGRPYLIPCKTTHSRLVPRKHSFGYSYLVVGIPVGISGNFNGMISVQNERSSGFKGFLSKVLCGGWYNVNASDYLSRGFSDDGLRGKLDTYLRSQDQDPDDYPFAYLVTAGRFLGYHFNPVSLWYLYTSDKLLSAIILEVNNTFGERRAYLVRRDFEAELQSLKSTKPRETPGLCLTGSWTKDFHVSPFNSRKGTYSFSSNDPLDPGLGHFGGLDVLINLNSSKGQKKLVARLFSHGEAIDPESMSAIGKIKFLTRWFWVGFATFPRILKEATTLFFKRKLHVWYRPEPLKESIARHATASERALETAFRSYLRFLVLQCSMSLSVRYIASGITDMTDETLDSPSCREDDLAANLAAHKLQLEVLTPVFYTRFAQYAHDFEAIFTEMTDSGTIWTDQPNLLPKIFLKKASPPLHAATIIDYVYFKCIQSLRRRPSSIPRVSTSADPPAAAPAAEDIRDFRISSMDAYILQHADSKVKSLYRRTLLRLLVADKFFMGSPVLLSTALFVFKSGLAWFSVTKLSQAIGN